MGIEEKKTTFNIYPNPTSNVIQLPESDGTYFISNMQGQVVQQGDCIKSNVDISSLANGNYLVQIISEKGSAYSRFQKR